MEVITPVAAGRTVGARVTGFVTIVGTLMFWGGGDTGSAGFSRVHPKATIANSASVAKK